MITRDMIYSHEAADLLRTLSLYKTLLEKQVYRMFPDKKQQAIHTLVERYIKDGRIFRDQHRRLLSASPEPELDIGTIKAFWVLLDFLDETEYHSAGDFPIKLFFFSKAEMYEVIYAQPEQEALISQALTNKADDEGKKNYCRGISKTNLQHILFQCQRILLSRRTGNNTLFQRKGSVRKWMNNFMLPASGRYSKKFYN